MTPSPAPTPPPKSGLLRREALGFWFLGLGALGLVRAWMRATRHGGFETDTVSLLWLIGSAVLVVISAARIWRTLRSARR
ncbi:hypothetical protein GLE_3617 [Lysobacter enzymogenes]|uniref:Uncharacterized protein n=1 Tax=Lysobacter enzymogenes TaxID=69 RepID=A0A0S2DKL3_LYSEN|nr:hypothetical protein [Lysobacter enzymogenes]ALN58961.1 hypothetical protein GLE_3617 [Lysobacter enzymogenes]QCW27207.1 hypothetical protein FE772_17800 [Lysobacter enzymogenes]